MKKKFFVVILIALVSIWGWNMSYAKKTTGNGGTGASNKTNETTQKTSNTKTKTEYEKNVANCQNKGFLGSIICESYEFSKDREDTGDISFGKDLSDFLLGDDGIVGLLYDLGCLVICIATVVLGTKYIFAGAAGKADIKGSLTNFVVAVVMFALAKPIYNLLDGTLVQSIFNQNSFTSITSNLWGTIIVVVQTASIIGIVLTGLRYMFKPAEDKAKMKQNLIATIAGIVLIFCFSEVLDFLVNVASELIT